MVDRKGWSLVQPVLLLAMLFPAAAQTPLTGRAGTLVGGGSAKSWDVAGARAGEFNRITFNSDATFMAIEKNSVISGRWGLAEDGRSLYLFNRASGNWHSSDTLTLHLIGLSATRLSVRYAGGSGRTVRYHPMSRAGTTVPKGK